MVKVLILAGILAEALEECSCRPVVHHVPSRLLTSELLWSDILEYISMDCAGRVIHEGRCHDLRGIFESRLLGYRKTSAPVSAERVASAVQAGSDGSEREVQYPGDHLLVQVLKVAKGEYGAMLG